VAEASKIAERKVEPRPSDNLMQLHLHGSFHTGHLGLEPRSRVENGSVDLHNRLKVRDPVDPCMPATALSTPS
jgi:hypothetical protein